MLNHFKVYEQGLPYFITSSIIHWIPVFNRRDYFDVLANSFIYCIENRGLVVHAFVFMPNHFHVICSHAGDLSQVIGDIKRFTSGTITQMLERDGRDVWLRAARRAAVEGGQAKLWTDGFHPEQIHSEKFFAQKCDYLHDNPVRAGFVDEPASWRYSSAGFYILESQPVVPIVPIDW